MQNYTELGRCWHLLWIWSKANGEAKKGVGEEEGKEVIKLPGKKHMFIWQHFDLYAFVHMGSQRGGMEAAVIKIGYVRAMDQRIAL